MTVTIWLSGSSLPVSKQCLRCRRKFAHTSFLTHAKAPSTAPAPFVIEVEMNMLSTNDGISQPSRSPRWTSKRSRCSPLSERTRARMLSWIWWIPAGFLPGNRSRASTSRYSSYMSTRAGKWSPFTTGFFLWLTFVVQSAHDKQHIHD